MPDQVADRDAQTAAVPASSSSTARALPDDTIVRSDSGLVLAAMSMIRPVLSMNSMSSDT